MTDDPVVLILREAAARGRQLRLARERSGQIEARSEGNVSDMLLSDQGVGVTITLQRGDNAVDKEHSA